MPRDGATQELADISAALGSEGVNRAGPLMLHVWSLFDADGFAPVRSAAALAKSMNRNETTTRTHLSLLLRAGLLRRVRDGAGRMVWCRGPLLTRWHPGDVPAEVGAGADSVTEGSAVRDPAEDRHIDKVLPSHGLNRAAPTLRLLLDGMDPRTGLARVRVGDLAARLGRAESTVTEHVRRLRLRGLIETTNEDLRINGHAAYVCRRGPELARWHPAKTDPQPGRVADVPETPPTAAVAARSRPEAADTAPDAVEAATGGPAQAEGTSEPPDGPLIDDAIDERQHAADVLAQFRPRDGERVAPVLTMLLDDMDRNGGTSRLRNAEIARQLGITTVAVNSHVQALRRYELIQLSDTRDANPLFPRTRGPALARWHPVAAVPGSQTSAEGFSAARSRPEGSSGASTAREALLVAASEDAAAVSAVAEASTAEIVAGLAGNVLLSPSSRVLLAETAAKLAMAAVSPAAEEVNR